MDLPKNVQHIINKLEAAGHEAFIVGGCVRDALSGRTPKDWDITTSATPAQAKAIFPRTIDTGIKHGTITVLMDRQHYEVTTYRIDGQYLDSRRPETVTFTSDITEDLSRRDFTMNAIAYNPRTGFVDPFGGQADITAKKIRCVGEPTHRFTEDALRMLRAVRFAGTTGFAICPQLLAAIKTLAPTLQKISVERIKEELAKLVTSTHPQAVELLEATGLLIFILPGITGINTQWLKACPPLEAMRMALVLHNINPQKILKNLRYDNKTAKEICIYVQLLAQPLPISGYEIKKILRVTTQDIFLNFLQLKDIITPGANTNTLREIIAEIYRNNECYTLKQLAINGKDLAEMGIPKGEKMGEILEKLLDNVMQDPAINTKTTLITTINAMN